MHLYDKKGPETGSSHSIHLYLQYRHQAMHLRLDTKSIIIHNTLNPRAKDQIHEPPLRCRRKGIGLSCDSIHFVLTQNAERFES